MAVFYNSVIAYDKATELYDGSATAYAYSGNITLALISRYSLSIVGGVETWHYAGKIYLDFIQSSVYRRGFYRRPTITGISFRVVPNSSMRIRQYYKAKDPQVTGGCPQCGSYVYNQ